MVKHPQNRAERKRLAEAKALASPLFRQRKINAKKRQIKVSLEEKETEDELTRYRSQRHPGELDRPFEPPSDDELYSAG